MPTAMELGVGPMRVYQVVGGNQIHHAETFTIARTGSVPQGLLTRQDETWVYPQGITPPIWGMTLEVDSDGMPPNEPYQDVALQFYNWQNTYNWATVRKYTCGLVDLANQPKSDPFGLQTDCQQIVTFSGEKNTVDFQGFVLIRLINGQEAAQYWYTNIPQGALAPPSDIELSATSNLSPRRTPEYAVANRDSFLPKPANPSDTYYLWYDTWLSVNKPITVQQWISLLAPQSN